MFNNSQLTSITLLSEITILDKYIENGEYYLKLNFESEYYIEKYKIKDTIRTYKVKDEELYHSIDLDRSEDYIGITIQSTIDLHDISKEEERELKSDPFKIISTQDYSKYIVVVGVSDAQLQFEE